MDQFTENATPLGLYDPQFEHDACGIGAVVDIKGRKSHQTVSDALSIVERLEHRAGKDAEGKTGDGVGIMLQISHKFFSKVAEELNIRLGNEREYGVGMFFFPQNEHLRAQAMKLFELVTRKEGLEFLAWRRVPVDPDAVGQKARDCMPSIWQCFIKKPAKVSKGIEFDRRLYIVRRVFEQASNGTYVPSLSSRTIVYKGMFLVHDLRRFYADLQDPDYESAIGMVHSRFSTNTNPSWMRAHPNRFILHNGEINTIKGNTDAMLAREESIESPILQDDMNKILPIINTSGSDSAMLDNALEFMVMNGMDLPLAVMITIPEPWENNKNISQKKRDFYQYYATMLEPWDGPAAILFSDGDVVGAVLDRNGLRPSRFRAEPNQQGNTCRRAMAGMRSVSVRLPRSSIVSISRSSQRASASSRSACSAPKSTKPSPSRRFSWVRSASLPGPGRSILFTNTKVGMRYRRSSRQSVSVWLCTPSVPLMTSTA